MVTPAITVTVAIMDIPDTTIGLIMVITVTVIMVMDIDIDTDIVEDIMATDIMGHMG